MRVALVCPDLTGHLNPMTTLGRELHRRGHQVTLLGLPPAESFARRAGLNFLPFGIRNFDEEIAPRRRRLAELTGLRALRLTGHLLRDIETIALRDLPTRFRQAGIEAVVVDQLSPSGASVAEAMGLPFAVACSALHLHQEAQVPPSLLGWRHVSGPWARIRNVTGNHLLRWAGGPIMRVIEKYRREQGLGPVPGGLAAQHGLVQVAQQPAFFDFPRKHLPGHFHYTGPWHEAQRDEHLAFPWDRLNGKPLIYASMGTMQNSLKPVFRAILSSVQGLDVQLVLALGRQGTAWNEPAPANALVVSYAPQMQLLKKASLLITHAGLNTALEGLSRGLPMLCIPITNDQPGVAARIHWLGVGLTIPPGKITSERMREAIQRLMQEPAWRQAACRCQKRLQDQPPGVTQAAQLIESAFSCREHVRRRAA